MSVLPVPEDDQPSDVESVPPPVLVAQGLGLRTTRGWVYRDVSLELAERSLHVVVGRRGSGRSSLLLGLTGRMAHSVGTLAVDGDDDLKRIRSLTAVARVGEVIDLEPRHTVRESLAERCLIDNVPLAEGRRRFVEAAKLLGLKTEPTMLIEELPGRRVTRLAIALACVRPSHLIVLDDLERDLDGREQAELLEELVTLAANGPSIVVATVDLDPVLRAGVAHTQLVRVEDPVEVPAASGRHTEPRAEPVGADSDDLATEVLPHPHSHRLADDEQDAR